jgi:hypothetical protein
METTPALLTVATAVLLLLQTPPAVASLNVKLVPLHPPVLPEILVMDDTTGVWLTVILEVTVAVQLLESVTVNE